MAIGVMTAAWKCNVNAVLVFVNHMLILRGANYLSKYVTSDHIVRCAVRSMTSRLTTLFLSRAVAISLCHHLNYVFFVAAVTGK